jgi:hypothetical protein
VTLSHVGFTSTLANSFGVTYTEHASIAAGDRVVLFYFQLGAARTVTPPTLEWVLIESVERTGYGVYVYTAVRGGTSLSGSFESTTDNGNGVVGHVFRSDLGTPVLVDSELATGTGTAVTWPSLTGPAISAISVGFLFKSTSHIDGTSSVTWDNVGRNSEDLHSYWEAYASGGATGGQSLSLQSSGTWDTAHVYVRDFVPVAPGAPTIIMATAGDTQVYLDWTANADDGGATVTDWLVEYNGGGGWATFSHTASAATDILVTGLTNGTGYTFRVSGINSAGTGTASTVTGTITPLVVTGTHDDEGGTALDDEGATDREVEAGAGGGGEVHPTFAVVGAGGDARASVARAATLSALVAAGGTPVGSVARQAPVTALVAAGGVPRVDVVTRAAAVSAIVAAGGSPVAVAARTAAVAALLSSGGTAHAVSGRVSPVVALVAGGGHVVATISTDVSTTATTGAVFGGGSVQVLISTSRATTALMAAGGAPVAAITPSKPTLAYLSAGGTPVAAGAQHVAQLVAVAAGGGTAWATLTSARTVAALVAAAGDAQASLSSTRPTTGFVSAGALVRALIGSVVDVVVGSLVTGGGAVHAGNVTKNATSSALVAGGGDARVSGAARAAQVAALLAGGGSARAAVAHAAAVSALVAGGGASYALVGRHALVAALMSAGGVPLGQVEHNVTTVALLSAGGTAYVIFGIPPDLLTSADRIVPIPFDMRIVPIPIDLAAPIDGPSPRQVPV